MGALGIRRFSIDRDKLLFSGLLVEYTIRPVLLVALGKAEVAIEGSGDQVARVAVAGGEGAFEKLVREKIVIGAIADETLAAEIHTYVLQDESGVERILGDLQGVLRNESQHQLYAVLIGSGHLFPRSRVLVLFSQFFQGRALGRGRIESEKNGKQC